MLDFGFCLKGATQSGRKIRFVVDYKSLAFEPKVSKAMLSRYGFIHNIPRRRFSILVDSNKVYRCDFTTKLITDDPISEVFYNDVLEANKNALMTSEMLKPFFSYYVMDEKGMDLPGVPGIDDLKSATGLDQISDTFDALFLPILIGVGIYFGYPYFKKRKGKK